MPKASKNVLATDREVKAATANGERTDYRIAKAPGLQLRVTASGAKSWALAYKSPATGKWTKVALGQYPSIGLAEAKGRALELAAEVRKGRDPVHDKREDALAETFETMTKRYMREHENRNARAGKPSSSTLEAQRYLDRDILPKLGRLRAEAITRQQVMQAVEAVADRGSYVAADRTLGLIRAIYNWACATGRLDRNPALGLKPRNTVRARTRVLSPAELRAFWLATGAFDDLAAAMRDVFRLQLLTGVRISEVIGAPRAELHLERGLWTIAAIRTKAEREHVLPLSPLAVSIFRGAIARADAEGQQRAQRLGLAFAPSPWVFPSPHWRRNAPMTPHSATEYIARNRSDLMRACTGVDVETADAAAMEAASFNTHDLRRTLATQLGEMGIADEIIERILNHAPRSIAGRHYNHARYLGQMRHALEAWAERLMVIVEGREVPSNVVSLRSAAG